MFNRRQSISLMASAFLAAPSIARSADEPDVLTLRVVNSPPRCVLLPDGTWTGFDMEMTAHLCRMAGVRMRPASSYLAWPRAIKAMQHGALIQLLTTVSFREERTAFLDYICPYDLEEIVIITRKENAHIDYSSMDDFLIGDRPIERDGSTKFYPPFDKRYSEDTEFASHFIEMSATGSGAAVEHRISLAKRIHRGRIFGAMTDWYIGNAVTGLSKEQLGFPPEELIKVPVKLFGAPTTYLTAANSVPQSLRDRLRDSAQAARESRLFDEVWAKWFGDRPLPPRS